jgi:DnaJ domain
MKAVSKAGILRKTLILLLCVAPCWINAGCLQNDDLHDLGRSDDEPHALGRSDVAILKDTVIQLCHEILGIERNASPKEIKKAYRKLSLIYHPDKSSTNKEACTEVFIALKDAHDILNVYPKKGNVPENSNLIQDCEDVKKRLEHALKLKKWLEDELKRKKSKPTPPCPPKKGNVVDGTTHTTINDID